jgi:transposase-like protein
MIRGLEGLTQAGLRGSRQLKGRKAALVLVAVEKRGRGTGRARMEVIPDFNSTTLIAFLKPNVAPGSTVYTDGLKGFTGLHEADFKHVSQATSASRPAQGRETCGAPGRPRDWQPTAMADRDPSRRESRSPSGLPRRIRLSPQSAAAAHGRVPNFARPRDRAQAYALQADTRCCRSFQPNPNLLGLAETTV